MEICSRSLTTNKEPFSTFKQVVVYRLVYFTDRNFRFALLLKQYFCLFIAIHKNLINHRLFSDNN